MTRSRAIIVLGPHRSGTSTLTKGLACLGVELGDHLIPPSDTENPRGFFEDQDIMTLNERLLAAMDRSWHTVRPVDLEQLHPSDRQTLQEEATDLIRDRFAGETLWGFKDPRTCLLLPFWQEVLDDIGIRHEYVIALRHPVSVARSLQRRNGFPLEKGHLIWLNNTLAALAHSQGHLRAFCDYDTLLASPEQELKRIAETLSLPVNAKQQSAIRDYASEFVDTSLRHNRQDDTGLAALSEALAIEEKAYKELRALTDGNQPDDRNLHRRWKNLGKAYAGLSPLLACIDQLGSQDSGGESLKAQLDFSQKERNILRRQLREVDFATREWMLQQFRRHVRSLQEEIHILGRTRSWLLYHFALRLACRLRRRAVPPDALQLARDQANQLQAYCETPELQLNGIKSAQHLLEETLSRLFHSRLYWLVKQITVLKSIALMQRCVDSQEGEMLHTLRHLHDQIDAAFQLPRPPESTQPQHPLTTSDIHPRPHLQGDQRPVDIILPVYGGREETLACIKSVLESKVRTPYELIVINDASPEPELVKDLRTLAAKQHITLLENEENLGFVGTVNRGMTIHEDRDVVLLNADTEVCHDWLDRLMHSATSEDDIATVTPLSNNAEICSYPFTRADNPLPLDIDAAGLDTLCASVNAGVLIDVPTAVGFCMVIRRQALNQTGLFDQERFGRGYGEENDFCMRASKEGWRHVLDPHVFVFHKGGVSFSDAKKASIERALKVLKELHPSYLPEVADYIGRDPAMPFRRQLDIARMARNTKGTILLINHDLGGGTDKHVHDLAARIERHHLAAVIVYPDGDNRIRLERPSVSATPNTVFSLPDEQDALVTALKQLNTIHLHYHHLLHQPESIRTLPEALGLPYDVTLHDYFAICPRTNLVDGSNRYCGEPEAEVCTGCIRKNGSLVGRHIDVPEWRDSYNRFLQQARRIYVPSRDTAERLQGYFPKANIAVHPHFEDDLAYQPAAASYHQGETLRVAIIGAIGPHKGSEILLACARDAKKRRLPLRFHLIGHANNEHALAKTGKVEITGPYENGQFFELLKSHECHLAFLPSVWPETYCYTLSLAMAAGLYPVSFDIGAIAERLNALGWGKLLPLDMPARSINDTLLSLKPEVLTETAFESARTAYPDILTDYYAFPSVTNKVKAAQPSS